MAEKKRTKAEIVETLSEKTGVSKRDVKNVLDLFLEEVKESLCQREAVELRGFGTFDVKVRKGRDNARNPRTGESITIAAHGIVAFKPGLELKKGVWDHPDDKDRESPDSERKLPK